MVILVASLVVECIAIGAVAQRRTFVMNRLVEYQLHRRMEPFPTRSRDVGAGSGRVNLGGEQYFRCI